MTENVSEIGRTVWLSIITVHLNDPRGLERTLASLSTFADRDTCEWIVIDGGSDEGNDLQTVLKKVEDRAGHFVSEADSGIYDAMNKGTRLASGEYVLYLNAGDELHPEFNPGQLREMLQGTHADMIWGRCQVVYQDGARVVVKTRSRIWAWYCMPAYHPAIIFKRSVLGSEPYLTHYRYASDYELVCRLLQQNVRIAQPAQTLSIYHRGGLSDVQGDVARAEENEIRLKYFSVPVFAGSMITKFKQMNTRSSTMTCFFRSVRKWV